MVGANPVPTSGQLRDARTRTAAELGPRVDTLRQVATVLIGVVELATTRTFGGAGVSTPAQVAELAGDAERVEVLAAELGTTELSTASRWVQAWSARGASIGRWNDQITATAAAHGQRRLAKLIETPEARRLTVRVARAARAASTSLEQTADETHDLVEEQLARISNLPYSLIERVLPTHPDGPAED